MEQFATRCPHCQTSFRVTPAQLERRGGQVRCGVCQQSFDGIDQLFDYSDSAPLTATADTALQTPGYSDNAAETAAVADVDADLLSSDQPDTATGKSMQAELDALSQAIADLRAAPWSGPQGASLAESEAVEATPYTSGVARDDVAYEPVEAAAPQEPGFVQSARQRDRRQRLWKIGLWIGIPLLTLALAAQLVYTFRNDIAARSPQAARQLRNLCVKLGCTIRLPMQLDKLSLTGSRLDISSLPAPINAQESPLSATSGLQLAQRLTLIALMRNQGDTAQAWPSIELRLKDTAGKIFVRKVFLPAQYLRAEDLPTGMQPHSEIEIRIPFDLSGDAPAGFEMTLFHH